MPLRQGAQDFTAQVMPEVPQMTFDQRQTQYPAYTQNASAAGYGQTAYDSAAESGYGTSSEYANMQPQQYATL